MTTSVPRQVDTGNRVLRATFRGIAIGYIVGWIAFGIRSGIWSDLIKSFAYSMRGGRGESADWGEPAVFAVLSLLPGVWELLDFQSGWKPVLRETPGVWTLAGALIGGALAALASRQGWRLRSRP